MNWNNLMRQIHRWLSIAFTAGFLINAVGIFVLGQKHPPFWQYLLALIPLFLLLPTGLYLFALPYVAGWGGRRRASPNADGAKV